MNSHLWYRTSMPWQRASKRSSPDSASSSTHDISHELRSPLARLNVALDLAREREFQRSRLRAHGSGSRTVERDDRPSPHRGKTGLVCDPCGHVLQLDLTRADSANRPQRSFGIAQERCCGAAHIARTVLRTWQCGRLCTALLKTSSAMRFAIRGSAILWRST